MIKNKFETNKNKNKNINKTIAFSIVSFQL